MDSFIRIEPLPPNPKTKRWSVKAKDGGALGVISWYGPWRKYAFNTNAGCVFEEICLREIAEFCERETKIHRNATLTRSEQ